MTSRLKSPYQPISGGEASPRAGIKPGAQALMDVYLFYRGNKGAYNAGIFNYRPVRGGSGLSLHSAGRALDVGVPNNPRGKALGDELFLRTISAGQYLGICEIIWWDKRVDNRGIKPYRGADNHHTHLHIGLTREFAALPNTQTLRFFSTVALFGFF